LHRAPPYLRPPLFSSAVELHVPIKEKLVKSASRRSWFSDELRELKTKKEKPKNLGQNLK